MLAPRHLVFSALEGALIDPRTGSFAEAEEALSELDHRKISLVLVSPRTRAEVEPIRRNLGHAHPFITEYGGGIFFPDGYFAIRIPGVVRWGRYMHLPLGRPYKEVIAALDDIAEECGVGVAGFHHMSTREIAENTGLRPREAELAREREFDEPFYFTSADEKAVARFVSTAKQRGFDARPGDPFWHFSSGCDGARAIRAIAPLFRQGTHLKLQSVGIGASAEDIPWLRAVDHAVLLPGPNGPVEQPDGANLKRIASGENPGPAGWNATIMNIIS